MREVLCICLIALIIGIVWIFGINCTLDCNKKKCDNGEMYCLRVKHVDGSAPDIQPCACKMCKD